MAPTRLPMPPSCSCKSDETKLKSDSECGCGELQKEDEAGCARQPCANKKGKRNDTINIDTHERGSLTILGHSAHRSPNAGAGHHPLKRNHQHRGSDNDDNI